ncbi:MAG: hypothetical protein HY924_03850 [Elusimicrobia bacterium]|nr:hypothetical protein [Elusimicrobiota bacterium]
MPTSALFAALLASSLRAQTASTASVAVPELSTAPAAAFVRLALIEPSPHRLAATLDLALERVIKERGPSASLLDTETVPCGHSGRDYRFPFPAEPGQALALAGRLDSEAETAFVVPPVPSLMRRLLAAAQDPATYRSPWSVSFSSGRAALSITRDHSGSAEASTAFGAWPAWQPTLATVYRLDWEGAEVRVFLTAKPYGGLGRLAAALEAEAAQAPFIGVAREGVFGGVGLKTKGAELASLLERLGLKASGVGCEEIAAFSQVQDYRRRSPDGVRLLSANLVYSSAPAQTVFDDHMTFEEGGLKVLLTAVTPQGCAKFLKASGLGHLSVADPAASLASRMASWRRTHDAVVLLAGPGREARALEAKTRGVDLILSEDRGSADLSLEPAQLQVEQRVRRGFDAPLLVMKSYPASLGLLEFSLTRGPQGVRWKAAERHLRLDERFPEAPGLPSFDPADYGLGPSTSPTLLPSAAEIFPQDSGAAWPRITAHGFWSMAASLVAEHTGSEAALLRATPLGVEVEGGAKEGLLRLWLGADDAVVVRLPGSRLRPLLAEAEAQTRRAFAGQAPGGAVPLAAGGIGPGGTVHGDAPADHELYRVAVSRVLLDVLNLKTEAEPEPAGPVQDIVIAELKERAGAPAQAYRDWMKGRPLADRGLWRVDFRDIGLNVQSTRVIRDDAFSAVPNSRIQGYDELLIGGVLKADAEYLRSRYKWKNTAEVEYARSAVTRRGEPRVVNITANSVRLLTLGTRRAGGIGAEWFARSWGPSLGVQFDGQVEAVPGLRRREVYSMFPGVEFYDGSWISSLEVSGSFRRDLSRDPPDTQSGLRSRLTLRHDVGTAGGRPISIQGEAHASYYFLTERDRPQDLRMEGGVIAKLRIPVYKHLSIAPFVDLYWFGLKVRPLWGYSAVTGVSIGFSRLWKPQFERF